MKSQALEFSNRQERRYRVFRQFRGLYKRYSYKVLAGGRASGKSVAAADAITFYMETKRCRILCLRSYENSIEQSIRAEIISSMEKKETRHLYKITDYEIVNLITGSVLHFKGIDRNPETVKSYSGYNVAVIEEAQTISEKAWQMLDPTIRKGKCEIWLILNPRLSSDIIWRVFLTGNPPPNTWISRSTYLDNPLLSEKARLSAEHMRDNAPEDYAHHYMGQLLQTSDMQIVKLKDVLASHNRQITVEYGATRIAALDVARFGKNDSVLWWRTGDDCTRFKSWNGLDSRQLMLAVIDELRDNPVDHLIIDDVGVGGAGVTDHIRPYLPNVRIHRFLGGGKPQDPTRFNNQRTECYFLAAQAVATTSRWANDSKLTDQACAICYDYDNKDHRRAESKESLDDRGVPSPDMFDALSMTYMGGIHGRSDDKPIDDYVD